MLRLKGRWPYHITIARQGPLENFKALDPVSLFAHDDEICGAMQHCRPPRI